MSKVFKTLSQIDVSAKTKKKNGLTYLPWSSAWNIVKSIYPDASFEIVHTLAEDKVPCPYFASHLGIMVRTNVTIEGEKQTMHLPVTNHKNQALKETQQVIKTKYGESIIPAATMFDVNTAIMRCLVKNLSLFGLGLYIYEGEDLPQSEEETKAPVKNQESNGKIRLDYNSSNFNKVSDYVVERKSKGSDLKLIMRQLKTKYDISEVIELAIKEVYDA